MKKNEDLPECPKCNNGLRSIRCIRCKGRGKVKNHKDEYEHCIACRMTGKLIVKCDLCDGTGKIEDWIKAISSNKGYVQ